MLAETSMILCDACLGPTGKLTADWSIIIGEEVFCLPPFLIALALPYPFRNVALTVCPRA